MTSSFQEGPPSLQIGMFDYHNKSRRCERYIITNCVQYGTPDPTS